MIAELSASAHAFDRSSLNIVAEEVSSLLIHAELALNKWSQGHKDATELEIVQEQLSQAHGALDLIGVPDLPRVLLELFALISDVRHRRCPSDDLLACVGRDSAAAIRRYVSKLAATGRIDRTDLIKIMQDLLDARAAGSLASIELSHPDLSWIATDTSKTASLTSGNTVSPLHADRSRYQKGLLLWLREEKQQGLLMMRASIENVYATCAPGLRASWWATAGLLDLLVEGELASDNRVKHLCMALDQPLRRTIEGVAEFPHKLLREILHYIVKTPGKGERVQKLRQLSLIGTNTFDSDPSEAPDLSPWVRELASLRALLDTIEPISRHETARLGQFVDGIVKNRLADPQRRSSEDAALEELFEQLACAASRLIEGAPELTEGLAVETAAALLFLRNVVSEWNVPRPEHFDQIAAVTCRLRDAVKGCVAGNEKFWDKFIGPAWRHPATRRVATELLSLLSDAEQRIAGFASGSAIRGEVDFAYDSLRQISGTLRVLGEDLAATAACHCVRVMEEMNMAGKVIDPESAQRLASVLAGIRFYLEQLQFGSANFQEIMARMGILEIILDTDNQQPKQVVSENPHKNPEMAFSDGSVNIMFPPESEPKGSHESAQDPELLDAVITEGRQLLGKVKYELGRLKTDALEETSFITLRRCFHTMRGSFNMLQLTREAEAASKMERIVDEVLEGRSAPDREFIEVLETTYGQFNNWLDELEYDGEARLYVPDPGTMAPELSDGHSALRQTPTQSPFTPATSERTSSTTGSKTQGPIPELNLMVADIAQLIGRLHAQVVAFENESQVALTGDSRAKDARPGAAFPEAERVARLKELAGILHAGANDLVEMQNNLIREVSRYNGT
jgi:Hpt domain